MRASRQLAGLAALGLSCGVAAEGVYKSVGPDGSISYGDKPAASARQVEQVELLPPPDIDAVLEAMLTTERIKESANQLETERRAREQLEADIRAEQEARAAAERAIAEQQALDRAAAEAAEKERLEKLRKKQKKEKKDKKSNHPPPLETDVPWPTPPPPAINMAPGVPLLNSPGAVE